MKSEKIKHLDGLRGIAAMIVVFSHLKWTFFLGEFEHLFDQIHLVGFPIFIEKFIINLLKLLTDGNLAVWLFWILSSYVISIKFFRPHPNYNRLTIEYFTKRYFRLAIPVLISALIGYLLLKFGLFYHMDYSRLEPNAWLDSMYSFQPNMILAIQSGLYDSFLNFSHEASYNPVLWSIQNEFLGSIFTFTIFAIARHYPWRFYLYIALTTLSLMMGYVFLASFLIGHSLCDYDFTDSDSKLKSKLGFTEAWLFKYKWIILVLSFFAIVFGRSGLTDLSLPYIYHGLILSLIILYICIRSQVIIQFLSTRSIAFLGKISFSIYLIHLMFILSFSCYFVIENTHFWNKIFISGISIVLIIGLAVIYERYIDRKAIQVANRIGKFAIHHLLDKKKART